MGEEKQFGDTGNGTSSSPKRTIFNLSNRRGGGATPSARPTAWGNEIKSRIGPPSIPPARGEVGVAGATHVLPPAGGLKGGLTLTPLTAWGLLNYIGTQIGWFVCALGAAQGVPWVGLLYVAIYLGLHLWWSPQRKYELWYIAVVGLLGTGLDSLKKIMDLLTYASDSSSAWLAPLWITAMWLIFSTTLTTSLRWLQGRYALAACFGAIGGSLAYIGGERLGGVSFNGDWALTVMILALVWGAMIPMLAWLAKRMVTDPAS